MACSPSLHDHNRWAVRLSSLLGLLTDSSPQPSAQGHRSPSSASMTKFPCPVSNLSLPPSFKGLCEYAGTTCMIQDHLPISRCLIRAAGSLTRSRRQWLRALKPGHLWRLVSACHPLLLQQPCSGFTLRLLLAVLWPLLHFRLGLCASDPLYLVWNLPAWAPDSWPRLLCPHNRPHWRP